MRTQTTIGDCGTGGGGGGGTTLTGQVFRYTADGTETDDFVLTLPVAAPDTNFNAVVTGGGLAFQLTFDVIVADNTINTIHVKSSAVLTNLDVLQIEIMELT